MTDIAEVKTRLAEGRTHILEHAPYIASTLMALTPVVITGRPNLTMAITPGLVLYVGAEWFLSDPVMANHRVIAACLYHECEHVLRDISRVLTLENKEIANIAADMAINHDLREEGWELPGWAIYPEKHGLPPGMTLEWYYDELLKKMQEDGHSSAKEMMDAAAGEESEDGEWEQKIGNGVCGSGAGNPGGEEGIEELEAELDAEDGKSAAEVEGIRQDTLNDIQEYAKAMGAGSVPGHFKIILENRIRKPEVNWRRELRRVLRRSVEHIRSGSSDYSMRRPSVSGALVGVVSSGIVTYDVEVALVEDTSASMDAPQLLQARNEGYHVLSKLGIREAWHMQIDCEVQALRRVRLKQLAAVKFEGRGGTDFRPAFERLAKCRPRPSLVVVFSDGDGPAPKDSPKGMAVVWCIVRTRHARQPALWGKTIVCDRSQELMPPYPSS